MTQKSAVCITVHWCLPVAILGLVGIGLWTILLIIIQHYPSLLGGVGDNIDTLPLDTNLQYLARNYASLPFLGQIIILVMPIIILPTLIICLFKGE